MLDEMVTHTEAGRAIKIMDGLAVLSDPKWGTQGSVGLFMLLDDKDRPSCWALMWQWGGDWMVFGDGQETTPDELQGWEPDAVEEAVKNALEMFGGQASRIEADLEWFSSWAEVARETLALKNKEGNL